MQEQSLLYFYMTSKLQHVGYHCNRFHCKLKCLKHADYEQGRYIRGSSTIIYYVEFTKGSAHAQNFIKFCRKIVYYMCVLFVRYLPKHLYPLLNLTNVKF